MKVLIEVEVMEEAALVAAEEPDAEPDVELEPASPLEILLPLVGGGVDEGLDNGVEGGVEDGVDAGVELGVDAGVELGIDEGVDEGMDEEEDGGADEEEEGADEESDGLLAGGVELGDETPKEREDGVSVRLFEVALTLGAEDEGGGSGS